MSLLIQMIRVHYQGKYLKLLDSDDVANGDLGGEHGVTKPPVYHTLGGSARNTKDINTCMAAFRALSLGVTMCIRRKKVRLDRSSALTRTYFNDFRRNACYLRLPNNEIHVMSISKYPKV